MVKVILSGIGLFYALQIHAIEPPVESFETIKTDDQQVEHESSVGDVEPEVLAKEEPEPTPELSAQEIRPEGPQEYIIDPKENTAQFTVLKPQNADDLGRTAKSPPSDTIFLIPQAPQYGLKLGGGAYGNQQVHNGGGTLQGYIFLEQGKRLNLKGTANFDFGEGGVGGGVDLRSRLRIPLDAKHHHFWLALGIDARAQAAMPQTGLRGYGTVQVPKAAIGTMFQGPKGKCVFRIFATAAFGLFDSQNQTLRPWKPSLDTFVQPAVGLETLENCKSLWIEGRYEHIMNPGQPKGVDRAQIEISQAWRLKPVRRLAIGYFIQSNISHQRGGPEEPVMFRAQLPDAPDATFYNVFGGVVFRFEPKLRR